MAVDEAPIISCTFPPSLETPDHIAIAESLGYRRAWVYDSPSLYADPWMILALAAARTETIGLGPASLVPSLRHPLVNAAALATLEALAPGRAGAAFGTGLTGRMLLGERPMRWEDVAHYVRTVRALLRGEEAEWDGKVVQLLHPSGFAASRPVEATILVAADGPRGAAIADELGDGVVSARAPRESDGRTRTVLTFGTVLDDGEQATDSQVVSRVAPAMTAAYHRIYESEAEAVDKLPGGSDWRSVIEAVDPSRRHLAIHDGHLVAAGPHDDVFVSQAAHLVPKWTTTGTPAEIRARLDKLAAAGVSEIAFQPMGPDIARELRAFAEAAGVSER